MQENNFEKRVQEQMEELRFRPSPAVWQKVEEEIRKRKKRRVVFFLSLLAGLCLLGYTGYFLFKPITTPSGKQATAAHVSKSSSDHHNEIAGTANQLQQEQEPAETSSGNHITQDQIAGTPQQDIQPTPATSGNDKTDTKANTIAKIDPKIYEQVQSKNVPDQIKQAQTSSTKEPELENATATSNNMPGKKSVVIDANLVKPTQDTESETSRELSEKLTLTPGNQSLKPVTPDPAMNAISSEVTADVDSTSKTDIAAIPVVDSSALSLDSAATKNDLAISAEQTTSPSATKTKTSRIELGLELSYGFSGDSKHGFPNVGTQKALMDQLNNAPPANFGTPATSAIYYLPPATVKSGTAFRAGVIASMRLSKRSKVSSGLRYAYFSHQLTTGGYKDTAVSFSNSYLQNVNQNAIYRGYEQKSFVNRFHFIQVPLQYELQLNKGRKVPIAWNLGVSAGYLFSTNALVYDSAAHGRYYPNKKAFNKMQWGLNTGFSFRFGIRNKIQWSVGPELSMGLNKLMKDGYTPTQYLFYGGITGRIFLTKKK
jgi:hypothetical protein